MVILFDLRSVGLGNNGGSLTLIKSGNTLQKMGHEVYFLDSGRNQHTWTKLDTKHIRPKKETQIPDADFIIATGYKSVSNTVSAPSRCGHKVHWIRGWETWQFAPKKIVAHILQAPTIKLVNSMGLKNKLKSFNFKSEIIRPGYDLDELTPERRVSKKRPFVIGGLYTSGKHEHIKRSSWVYEAYNYLKGKYGNVRLYMIGNDRPHYKIDRIFHRPTMKEKQQLYNSVDVWLSPAIQEGLHMPPAEAMMTGCPVVGVRAELSGTHDYLVDGISGIVTKNKLGAFVNGVEKLYLDKELRLDMGKRARKKVEEIGDREHNMKKMIKYLTGITK